MTGVVKTHKLHYETTSDVLHARYNRKLFPHHWTASPKIISMWLAHFGSTMEEVTMVAGPSSDPVQAGSVGKARLLFRSFQDVQGDGMP